MDALRKEKKHFNYSDYITWNDKERCELIDGVAYNMSPAPSWCHQGISGNLYGQLFVYLRGKRCRVFAAPFDVRLNAETSDDTVVQPDLIVICDHSKLCGTGCTGTPDMVVEVISPSTAAYDKVLKFNLYRQAGVREYWIIDPDTRTVATHVLKDGEYITRAFSATDKAPVHIMDGCTINLIEVFADCSEAI